MDEVHYELICLYVFVGYRKDSDHYIAYILNTDKNKVDDAVTLNTGA